MQLSKWAEATKRMEETDYASRVDLVCKVHGLEQAEKYVENISESSRGETIYGVLLANCVVRNDMKRAEEIFSKMKDLKFPISAFSCGQMLHLYQRRNREKITDLLSFMENENVRHTPFTYRVLIDIKGRSRDIAGMESILDIMKREGIEPDCKILAALAKYYAAAGLKEKAEAVLKVMEGDYMKENSFARRALITLYAELGNASEVERIWKACEPSPRFDEFVAAMRAWGKLNRVESAEAIFAEMSRISSKIAPVQYAVLLNVYAENKMAVKWKDLFERMLDSGCKIRPFTWDALIRFYVDAGETEKAEEILEKAVAMQLPLKRKLPLRSYLVILEQYARRGDVSNAEKIFLRMREAGYEARVSQYTALIEAYVNAKVPAYGMKERMKGDLVSPNNFVSRLLLEVDPFKKTALSDLLD